MILTLPTSQEGVDMEGCPMGGEGRGIGHPSTTSSMLLSVTQNATIGNATICCIIATQIQERCVK